MKSLWIGCLSVFLVMQGRAQSAQGMEASAQSLKASAEGTQPAFDARYMALRSSSKVQDKDFYLFTLMEAPACRAALEEDTLFAARTAYYRGIVSQLDSAGQFPDAIRQFLWSQEDMESVGAELKTFWARNPEAGHFLVRQMRLSGYWIRYSGESDTVLLRKAWEDAVRAENRVIQNYTTNKGFRYAAIDSGSFAPSGEEGREMLMEMGMMVWRQKDSLTLFFQPSLEIALGILFVNDRDEAARFEPLDSTNRSAYRRVAAIPWAAYPYSFILLPGEGPENDQPISSMGKLRCQLGAEQYKRHLAPFIVVSGGYVHPFQTPYCEAAQMKAYLVGILGIPEDAVILEPHARHTTTNIRNANRILFRSGMPVGKRVLCTSTSGQIAYILSPFFAVRCKNEMGCVPYLDMKRIDPFDLSYLPDPASLQLDAVDPLDP
jgi:hypothetical protein